MLERWFVVPLAAGSQAIALNGLSVNGQSRLSAGDALTIGSVTYMIAFEDIVEQEVGAPRSGRRSNSLTNCALPRTPRCAARIPTGLFAPSSLDWVQATS